MYVWNLEQMYFELSTSNTIKARSLATHSTTFQYEYLGTLLLRQPRLKMDLLKWIQFQFYHYPPWRRGIVVIVSASRTEDPGFESRQGVRFLGLHALSLCVFEKK
jgi:hypothetical protein